MENRDKVLEEKRKKKELDITLASEKEVDEFTSRLKNSGVIIAGKVLKLANTELAKLIEIEAKNTKLIQEAGELDLKGEYIGAAKKFWESYMVIHNEFGDKLNEERTLLSIGLCLLKAGMPLTALIYLLEAKNICINREAKDEVDIWEKERVTAVCDGFIETIRKSHPFLSKEIERIKLLKEGTSDFPDFKNFNRDSLPFFHFGVLFTKIAAEEKKINAPKIEIAILYLESSKACLEARGAYELALGRAKDAQNMFKEINNEDRIKKTNELIQEITKRKTKR